LLNDSSVKYTADKIDKSEEKIMLMGNAKISSTQNDVIETDEIIITFN
jgi:lipopolysaccharide export system protein LptA